MNILWVVCLAIIWVSTATMAITIDEPGISVVGVISTIIWALVLGFTEE